MHVSQKFERLLDAHRRPDGGRWTGQKLDEATGGVVTRSYVTNLRKGRIESPGYEKLAAVAKAMGFSRELWFEEGLGDGMPTGPGTTPTPSPAVSSTSSMPSGTRRRASPTRTPRLPA
jgi:transcriptional regulator with XRE-family HTH domain